MKAKTRFLTQDIKAPSFLHSNRLPHNWSIYDAQDRSLIRYKGHISGVLYDLGCGEAPYRAWLEQYCHKYIGVDWPESPHKRASEVSADLNESLPIQSEIADTVTALAVLEHLYNPEKMLVEAHRILKPGGTFLLQVPWQWWLHEVPHDYFRYTPFCLERMLKNAGFTEICIEAQSGFFTMIVLKLNYFSLRIIKGPRLIRTIVKTILSVFWFIGQVSAKILDKLDKSWELEASGYFAIAKKPVYAKTTQQ